MEYLQMNYFCEVYRLKSISKAARQLHITQPTMSSAILNLEQQLGYPLFVRLHQQLYPTVWGTLLYEEASPFVQSMGRLEYEMRHIGSGQQQIILAKNIQSSALLLESITRFRILHPEIRIETIKSSSSQNGELLRRHKADLAFGNLEHLKPKEEEGRLFLEEETQYCTNENSPLAGYKKVTIPDIAGRPLAVMRHGFDQYSLILKSFQRYRMKPNIILYAEELHSLIELAKKGIADSFLFSRIIKHNPPLHGASLTPVRHMHLGFWWRKDHKLTDTERCLMDFIYDDINGGTDKP
ncbi:MAG: LysR family transcriptional regulator [Hungatella sp.]|nr:LysR family transcriptional regulator [Hungatella sp.]